MEQNWLSFLRTLRRTKKLTKRFILGGDPVLLRYRHLIIVYILLGIIAFNTYRG